MNHYFIGLMLASSANMESGIAVLDRNNELILLDKLFTMQDVQHLHKNSCCVTHLLYHLLDKYETYLNLE